jgi:hypothetical protein
MKNKTPCKGCVHFDQRYKFVQGKRIPSSFGWCAAKSTYPETMPPGYVVPPGAKQVGPGERHLPVIVEPNQVVADCLSVLKKG